MKIFGREDSTVLIIIDEARMLGADRALIERLEASVYEVRDGPDCTWTTDDDETFDALYAEVERLSTDSAALARREKNLVERVTRANAAKRELTRANERERALKAAAEARLYGNSI